MTNNFINTTDKTIESQKSPNFDIINPSFTINNEEEKIVIKAKRGNFLKDNKILLEKDVIFKSPRFTLSTNSVIYNRENQSAQSSHKSKFNSDGTIIISEGFEIINNGNVILFNGNTNLIINNNSL